MGRLTRRTFMAGAAMAGASTIIPRSLYAGSAEATEPRPLRIPDLIDARDEGQAISLSAQSGETSFDPNRQSRTLGYNGSYLGPTLRVHRGDEVEIAVTNTLQEDTTAHWHGLLIPAEVDGSPHQSIAPGETWRPTLSIQQPAATLWYHSHAHSRTAEQVYAGLAGLLLVTDDEERSLGLPGEYGIDDIPLVLQDRQFEDGRLVVPSGMMTLMTGRRGDTLLVNGTPNPVARVPGKLVRLRLVNGSNARIFDLSFSDGRKFHWIASDGGLLQRPVAVESLLLAPGERAEVLVDFSDGRSVSLQSGPDRNAPMMMGMMNRIEGAVSDVFGADVETLLRLEPNAPGSSSAIIPDRLVSWDRPDPSMAVRRRQVRLTMGMGGMMGRGMMGDGGMMNGGGMFGINGESFRMDRIDERVRLGDVEIWEASGDMMSHPLHIHGVHFEVLSRNGGAPSVRDQGLRDTVLVNEPVELLVRFTQPAVEAPFMYHCHILEHEDNGMMAQFLTA